MKTWKYEAKLQKELGAKGASNPAYFLVSEQLSSYDVVLERRRQLLKCGEYIVRFLLLIFFFNCTAFANSNTNVVIIEIEYILDNSIAVQKVKTEIEKTSVQMQKFFEKREKELKALENTLIEKKNTLENDKWQANLKDFNAQVTLLKQELQKKKSALEQARENAMIKVHKEINIIINELANEYNFNLVIPSNVVIFADDNINITSIVLERLNTKLKSVSIGIN